MLAAGQLGDEIRSSFGVRSAVELYASGESIFLREFFGHHEFKETVLVSRSDQEALRLSWIADLHPEVKITCIKSDDKGLLGTLEAGLAELGDTRLPCEVIYSDTVSKISVPDDVVVVGKPRGIGDWLFADLTERAAQSGPNLFSGQVVFSPSADRQGPLPSGEENMDGESVSSTSRENVMRLSSSAVVGRFTFSNSELLHNLTQRFLKREPADSVASFFEMISDYSKKIPMSLAWEPEWVDLGHIESLEEYQSRLVRGRHFNSLSVDESGWVLKSSTDGEKMWREYSWFRGVPSNVWSFLPRVGNFSHAKDYITYPDQKSGADAGYLIQYLPAPTLAERYVFGDPELVDWVWYQESLDSWFLQTAKVGAKEEVSGFDSWFSRNCLARWDAVSRILTEQVQGNERVFLKAQVECARWLSASPSSLIHGDLVFSNVIASESKKLFKLIDPRGGFADKSVWGPTYYDWGKLAQSIVLKYDFLISSRFEVAEPTSETRILPEVKIFGAENQSAEAWEKWFWDRCPNPEAAVILGAVLLITAAPLHIDSPDRILGMVSHGLNTLEQRI